MGTLKISLSSDDEVILRQIGSTHHMTDVGAAATCLSAYLRTYAQYEAEQTAKVRAGLDAADRGEFVPDAEMDTFFATHGVDH